MRKILLLFSLTLLLIGSVIGGATVNYWQTANVKTQGRIEDPLEAWSECDIVVWQYNSTFFASRNMTTLTVMQLVANASQVLSNAVGNASGAKGSVYVRNGTYTASVTLKTNVWLTLDKGASGITVTIDAGATAWLVDGNAGRIRWWKAGSLVWDANMDAGTLTAASGLFSSWMNSTNINFTTLYMEGVEVQLVQPASFIIDVSGSNYRSWHGANSTLFETSTNASQVINDAVGNCSIGKVHIKNGTYLVDTSIRVPTSGTNYVGTTGNLEITGEGGTILRTSAAVPLFVSNNESEYVGGFQLSNMILDGNSVGTKGLAIKNLCWAKIRNVMAKLFAYDGFELNATSAHLADQNEFQTCTAYYNGRDGFVVGDNDGSGAEAQENRFLDCTAPGNTRSGIHILCPWNHVSGGDYSNNGINIWLDGVGAPTYKMAEYNTLIGVYTEAGSTSDLCLDYWTRYNGFISCKFGVVNASSIYASAVATGVMTDCTITSFTGSSPTGLRFSHSSVGGYPTENCGSWSGSSPVTVAHGCAGTPYVQITVNAVQPYTISCTVNATHIVIYHNGFDVVSGWWDAHYVP